MGLAGNRRIGELLRHIADHDTAAALSLFTRLWQDGKNPATVLGELSTLQRDLLLRAVAPRGGRELLSGGYDEALLASFDGAFSTAALAANIETLLRAMNDLRTGQARTVSELTLVTLCEPGLNDSAPMLRARVAALEARLANGVPAAPAKEVDMIQEPAPAAEEPPRADAPPADDAPPFDWEPPPPPEPPAVAAPVPEEVDITTKTLPPAAVPEGAGDGLWERILARVEAVFPAGIAAILTDPAQAVGELSGDTLTLRARSAFALNMLDRPDVTGKLAGLAAEAGGRPLRVRVTESGASAPAAEGGKLDELAQFPIVKFK